MQLFQWFIVCITVFTTDYVVCCACSLKRTYKLVLNLADCVSSPFLTSSFAASIWFLPLSTIHIPWLIFYFPMSLCMEQNSHTTLCIFVRGMTSLYEVMWHTIYYKADIFQTSFAPGRLFLNTVLPFIMLETLRPCGAACHSQFKPPFPPEAVSHMMCVKCI